MKIVFGSLLFVCAMSISACNIMPQLPSSRESSAQRIDDPISSSSDFTTSSNVFSSSENNYTSSAITKPSSSQEPIPSSQTPVQSSEFPVSSSQVSEHSSQTPMPSSQSPVSSSIEQSSEEHVHEFGEWVFIKEATCTEEGQAVHYCKYCDYAEMESFLPLGHLWDDGQIVTEDGEDYYLYTCLRDGCAATRVEAIDGYKININSTNCSVKVYVGPKDREDGPVFDDGPRYYSRQKESPYAYSKEEGRFNFEVFPDEGYEFIDEIDDALETIDVSYISGTYHKIKKNGEYLYAITKIASNLTLTINCTTINNSSHTWTDPLEITEDDIPDNDFHNLKQYQYLMDEDWSKFATYANGSDLSAPRAIKLRFSDVETAPVYCVQVSEDNSFVDAPVYTVTNKYYELWNAKLSTTYYYRAATNSNDLVNAEIRNLTTTDLAPRVMNVPNVLNFRDIGGWSSYLVPNGKIKQGLYYRCAQLNQAGSSSTRSELDSEGKGLAAIKELGIKVDIDMRDSYNVPSQSPANTEDWPVKLVKASIASGTESKRWEEFGDVYTLIFNTIANCDNEPAMLHCTYGADRTGIATFYLEALLGMDLNDIRRDYVWTKFTQGRDPNPNGELAKWIQKTEDTYEGENFAEKMKQHLMSKGISEETLEHIREIFIEGYTSSASWGPIIWQ